MRKICVVTGSRSEYFLLKPVLRLLQESSNVELQILVTGNHLSAKFGDTFQQIVKDGFKLSGKIDLDVEDDSIDHVNQSIAKGVSGLSGCLLELKPDLLVILGDRYEILSAAIAAMTLRIPIAHIHGGEKTIGALDDSIRHAITKMSSLHFASHESYRSRIIQMGEKPEHVFTVGSLGAEIASTMNLLAREELETLLDLEFSRRNILVTFHPETVSCGNPVDQVKELLKSLESLDDTTIVITYPNADEGSGEIIEALIDFVKEKKNRYLYKSLGIEPYLSLAKICDGVVGNSSSGLIEIPSLGVGTINIGLRQKGRILASSVINCEISEKDISIALSKLYSDEFRSNLKAVVNPLARKDTAMTIANTLINHMLENIVVKDFLDL